MAMNIYQSISLIMQETPAIGKEKKNQQQGFKYRGIDDVMNVFAPLLAKYKVFIVPEVMEHSREERTTKNGGNLIYSIMRIKFKFYAEDGSFVEAVTIGEGMDSADKSSNKAMAIAMKYAMFQVFCIPTEEMIDPDKTTPPSSFPNEQSDELPFPGLEDEKEAALFTRLEEARSLAVPGTNKKLGQLNKAQLQRAAGGCTDEEVRKAALFILDNDKSLS